MVTCSLATCPLVTSCPLVMSPGNIDVPWQHVPWQLNLGDPTPPPGTWNMRRLPCIINPSRVTPLELTKTSSLTRRCWVTSKYLGLQTISKSGLSKLRRKSNFYSCTDISLLVKQSIVPWTHSIVMELQNVLHCICLLWGKFGSNILTCSGHLRL